ncbi:uncharacterized protein BJ171DRAFT_540943 [Polychytrium aggregatum]|uniref:uncharacterized protein n=1 Tax=Polychytrium aggregatum TaxID=110093 RepID=UPI0022FDBE4A|nr:uncharacterized protein BJ171DRAFT_540943 [Polychytrium aggregatum]KAI9190732.1 hypothetical protein BJ171DRAFT_540943 [Polychytrium aggregatum]
MRRSQELGCALCSPHASCRWCRAWTWTRFVRVARIGGPLSSSLPVRWDANDQTWALTTDPEEHIDPALRRRQQHHPGARPRLQCLYAAVCPQHLHAANQGETIPSGDRQRAGHLAGGFVNECISVRGHRANQYSRLWDGGPRHSGRQSRRRDEHQPAALCRSSHDDECLDDPDPG